MPDKNAKKVVRTFQSRTKTKDKEARSPNRWLASSANAGKLNIRCIHHGRREDRQFWRQMTSPSTFAAKQPNTGGFIVFMVLFRFATQEQSAEHL